MGAGAETDLAQFEEPEDIDIRTVAVIWGHGEPKPTIVCSKNLSQFEALGLLRAAYRRFEFEVEDLIVLEGAEDDEEYDDDW